MKKKLFGMGYSSGRSVGKGKRHRDSKKAGLEFKKKEIKLFRLLYLVQAPFPL